MLSLSADQGPPPEGNVDHHRCIVHFDIDCFYAQVEEVLNPSLRGKPIGIKQKYLLVTCNYTARSLGVRKMESLAEAKRRCPSLVVMDGEDLTRYREASEAIFSYIAGVCGPLVQRLGMDEIFADVTGLMNTTTTTSSTTDITGHLYAPGSGGTLLEAQTGLEISLNVDGRAAGAHGMEGSAPVPGSPALSGTAEQLTAQSGGHGTSQESAEESEGGGRVRDGPVAATASGSGSSGVGQEAFFSGPDNGGRRRSGEGVGVLGGSEAGSGVAGGGAGGCRCGCWERLAATSAFAERVRTGLLEVVGYTCSAGIGCSKLAAKMAGELHKPHQQTTIFPEHTMSMVSQLPLRKLPGCGYSTCAKIKADLGITESRQLQGAPWPLLVRAVGLKLARMLFLLCRGEDGSPVVPSVRPKTMSDEDSFKRGTIRSRQQVELHARRLASPLLLRAGERVRLHKEAPETLRFGFRRASKGYGVRVSRQCAISSGVAAAWAAVAADRAVAGAAAAAASGPETAEGTEGMEVAATRRSDASATAMTEASPMTPLRKGQGQEQQQRRGQNGAAAEDALSEVVRLVMSMLDKMISPGEKLDLTLLSVGLAGFRSLGGAAQSGMARYLDQSQPSATDGGGSCSGFRTGTTSRGDISPLTSTPTTPRPATPHPATPYRKGSTSSAASLHQPHTAAPVTSVRKVLPEGATSATAPPAAGATVAPRSPPGAGTGASRAAAASTAAQGKKRPRVPPENPYRRQSPEQQQQPHQGRQQEHHHHYRHQRQQQDDAAASEWEGAEILVVGEGGDAVPGRGSLDWCGMCGAHVLRADAEEHYSSAFHQRRARDSSYAAAVGCEGHAEDGALRA